jgi:hypothetical protein
VVLALLAGCGGDGGEETTTSPFDAIPRAGDPGTRFGFNEDFAAGDGEIRQMAAIGADTARRRLSWTEIEPEPGAFNWASYDAIYDELLANGMRPLWVLVDAPCWARPTGTACGPSQPAGAPGVEHAADLGAFLAEAAKRYPESLGIEVGNEVNDERFWAGGVDPNDYTAVLGAAADAVHAANPEMPVVAAGLAPFERPGPGRLPWQLYVRAMARAGIAEKVDAFAFHPYPPAGALDVSGAVNAELDAFKAELARRGVSDEPVWVTEVGVSTVGPHAKTPDEQAVDLTSILTSMQDRGVPVAIIHRLRDGTVPGFPLEPGFGVVSADGLTPKPAYCALGVVRGHPC